MDQQRAKEIIHILSDGIDPFTGEVLPPDHVCNQPDVIRALHISSPHVFTLFLFTYYSIYYEMFNKKHQHTI